MTAIVYTEFGPPDVLNLEGVQKITTIIDRTYPLSEVPEAIRYLEEGHAKGEVVMHVSEEGA